MATGNVVASVDGLVDADTEEGVYQAIRDLVDPKLSVRIDHCWIEGDEDDDPAGFVIDCSTEKGQSEFCDRQIPWKKHVTTYHRLGFQTPPPTTGSGISGVVPGGFCDRQFRGALFDRSWGATILPGGDAGTGVCDRRFPRTGVDRGL